MGTLAVTYNGTTKSYTMTGAPAVAYNSKTLLTASSWSGTKTLKCAGKYMKTNVTVGARTLKTAGTIAKTDIVLRYTKASASTPSVVTASTTITVPEGYNKIQFFAVGGGGGSASAYTSWDSDYLSGGSVGAGGGGGYTKETSLKTIPGTKYTLSIGAGGTQGNDGTASIVYLNSAEVLRAEGGKASTEEKGGGNYSGHWWVYGGSGGSGGGYKTGSGGTDGGDGYGASSSDTYSRGKGQGSTTKCSFLTNSPAYGGGGGGSNASYNSYRYRTSAEANASQEADAMVSAAYKALAGGEYGGGHGTYTYMSGVYFDNDEEGEAMYDYTPRCINGTSGLVGSGGGAGGGARRHYDPNNGYSRWAGCNGLTLSGGSGVIIYRFSEE